MKVGIQFSRAQMLGDISNINFDKDEVFKDGTVALEFTIGSNGQSFTDYTIIDVYTYLTLSEIEQLALKEGDWLEIEGDLCGTTSIAGFFTYDSFMIFATKIRKLQKDEVKLCLS